MAKFKYKARDERGTYQESVLLADDIEEARSQLTNKGLWLLELYEAKDKSKSLLDMELDEHLAKVGLGGVGLKDKVIFCRQFATLINSGVAVVKALNILAMQLENKYFAKIILEVKNLVEQGSNLSDAFAAYPDVFDKLFINMVKAGETGGVMDEVLNRIAKFMEDKAKLSSKIKSAMTYPVVVSIVAISIFILMLTIILPKFTKIFARLDTELPAYTQLLMDLSHIMLEAFKLPWCLVIPVILVSIVLGYKKIRATENGRYYIDKFALIFPVIGNLLRKVAVARFTRTFSTLIKSGVPILTTLDITEESSGNAVLERAVKSVKEEVKQGGTISGPLERQKLSPLWLYL